VIGDLFAGARTEQKAKLIIPFATRLLTHVIENSSALSRNPSCGSTTGWYTRLEL